MFDRLFKTKKRVEEIAKAEADVVAARAAMARADEMNAEVKAHGKEVRAVHRAFKEDLRENHYADRIRAAYAPRRTNL